jgi:hypothetical protein
MNYTDASKLGKRKDPEELKAFEKMLKTITFMKEIADEARNHNLAADK